MILVVVTPGVTLGWVQVSNLPTAATTDQRLPYTDTTLLKRYTTLKLLGAIHGEAKLLSQFNVALVLTVGVHLTIFNPNTIMHGVTVVYGI